MPDETNYALNLSRVLDGLAESIADAPEEELLEELRQEGLDPAANAAATRALLLGAVVQHEQRLLVEARERIKARRRRTTPLTATEPEARRTLLQRLFTSQPQFAEMVTAHYRDLSQLTDSDVESCLEDLAELGVSLEPTDEGK